MRYKLTFAAGFAAGYVLGTKAGRKRYDTITDGVTPTHRHRRPGRPPACCRHRPAVPWPRPGAPSPPRLNDKVGDRVSARFGGGHLFGGHSDPETDSEASLADQESQPPYPAVGLEEFGGES